MMNRRMFLGSGAMAAIGTVATRGQSGYNPLLVSNSQTAHIGAIANASRGYMYASDWKNIVGTTTAMNTNLKAVNIDASVKQATAKLNPAQLSPALLSTAKANVLQAVKVYNPTCTAATIQRFTNSLNLMTSAQINNAVNVMRSLGLTPYIGLWTNHALKIEQALLAGYGGTYKIGEINPMMPPEDPGMGTGWYSCEDDSMTLDLAAVVMGVLAILATPGLGEIALVAGSGAIIGWGSAGVVGWTVGHVAFCGV